MKSFKCIQKYLKWAHKCNVDVILLGLKADDKTVNIDVDMINQVLRQHTKSLNSFMYHSLSASKGYGIIGLLNGLEFYTMREVK